MPPKKLNLKQLQALQIQWYEKLKASGFQDIEDSNGNLKQHNRRTIAFENRDRIRDFFTDLGHYIEHHDIPPMHKQILTLYCNGSQIRQIELEVKRTRRMIHNIIKIYKDRILRNSDD